MVLLLRADHREPDGAACFSLRNGGWIYAANSEVNGTGGGVAAIRFSAGGEIEDAALGHGQEVSE